MPGSQGQQGMVRVPLAPFAEALRRAVRVCEPAAAASQARDGDARQRNAHGHSAALTGAVEGGFLGSGLRLYVAQACLVAGSAAAAPSVELPCLARAVRVVESSDSPNVQREGAVRLHSVNLWVSPHPTRSAAHYDDHHNVLQVVSGRKRVWMAPPHALLHAAPSPSKNPAGGLATASPNVWGTAQPPGWVAAWSESSTDTALSEDAGGTCRPYAWESNGRQPVTCFHATLQPGSSLFIPKGWWHCVHSDAATAAVNVWYDPTPAQHRKDAQPTPLDSAFTCVRHGAAALLEECLKLQRAEHLAKCTALAGQQLPEQQLWPAVCDGGQHTRQCCDVAALVMGGVEPLLEVLLALPSPAAFQLLQRVCCETADAVEAAFNAVPAHESDTATRIQRALVHAVPTSPSGSTTSRCAVTLLCNKAQRHRQATLSQVIAATLGLHPPSAMH